MFHMLQSTHAAACCTALICISRLPHYYTLMPTGLVVVQDVMMSGQHQEEERAGASSSDQEANSETSDLQKKLEDYDLQI